MLCRKGRKVDSVRGEGVAVLYRWPENAILSKGLKGVRASPVGIWGKSLPGRVGTASAKPQDKNVPCCRLSKAAPVAVVGTRGHWQMRSQGKWGRLCLLAFVFL